MPFVRWLLSRIPSAQQAALLNAAARFSVGLIQSLRPKTFLMVLALALITTAAWRIHEEAALLLLGLLIMRDLELPDEPPNKS